MISMIASESLLRTDDFDTLVFMSDSEEVKADFPTASDCGKPDGSATADKPTDVASCKGDLVNRCCFVTDGVAETPKNFCIKTANTWSTDSVAVATALKNSLTGASSVVCPDKVAGKTIPAAKECGNAAAVAATGNVQADCDADTGAKRCCLATPKDASLGLATCVQSTEESKNTQLPATSAKTLNTLLNYGTVAVATCGPAIPDFPKTGDCGTSTDKAKAPADVKECYRELGSKCCKVTNSDKTTPLSFCLSTGSGRNQTDAQAKAYFADKYNIHYSSADCQAPGTEFPKASTCGKTLTADFKPANATICNTDKKALCCQITSASDKSNTKCYPADADKKGKNSTNNNSTTLINDVIGDLSAISCSSGFVSASAIAIVAFVMALF
jgi:hypothetical protein